MFERYPSRVDQDPRDVQGRPEVHVGDRFGAEPRRGQRRVDGRVDLGADRHGGVLRAQPADGHGAVVGRDRETGLEQAHAEFDRGDVPAERPHRVQGRGERVHASGRDPAPGGLQSGDPAAGGRNPHRAPGVGAVADVRLAGRDRDRRAAGRSARDQPWRPAGSPGCPTRCSRRRPDQHSSVRLVLPTILAPDRRAVPTTGASAAAGPARSAITGQPTVVGRPATSMQSLTASRGPSPGASRRISHVVMTPSWPAASPPRPGAAQSSPGSPPVPLGKSSMHTSR